MNYTDRKLSKKLKIFGRCFHNLADLIIKTKNKIRSAKTSAGTVHILHYLVCRHLNFERLINFCVELRYAAWHRLTEVRDECKLLKQYLKVWFLRPWMSSNWWHAIIRMNDAPGRKFQDRITCGSRKYSRSQCFFNDGQNWILSL